MIRNRQIFMMEIRWWIVIRTLEIKMCLIILSTKKRITIGTLLMDKIREGRRKQIPET